MLDDALIGHGLADDPGRCRINAARPAGEHVRHGLHRAFHGRTAMTAGKGVGVTGVDHEAARFALGQTFAAPQHGRRGCLAGRKLGQQHVGTALVPHPAGTGRDPHPADGGQ
jgi:hypothetical protein